VVGGEVDPVGAGADVGARVEYRGIRLGTIADVILDPRFLTMIGYEVAGVDGVARWFLPRIACGLASRACVEVAVPAAMLGGEELSFYREQGITLASLEDPSPGPADDGREGFLDRRNGYTSTGDRMRGDRVTSRFQATARDAGNGVVRVSVVGEADLYTAPGLRTALLGAIDGGARSVLVDLSRTTFLDSTTLGVLIGGVRRLRSSGGEIAVVCRDPNTRKIFEITLLDRILAIFDDVDEGLAYLTGSNGAAPRD
jgi:anti-sigma B factor antagonist